MQIARGWLSPLIDCSQSRDPEFASDAVTVLTVLGWSFMVYSGMCLDWLMGYLLRLPKYVDLGWGEDTYSLLTSHPANQHESN